MLFSRGASAAQPADVRVNRRELPSPRRAPGPRARRFAIVAPNFYPRTCGVGHYSVRLADELIRRGHAASVFSRAPGEPHPDVPSIGFSVAPGADARALYAQHLDWPRIVDHLLETIAPEIAHDAGR